MNDHTTNPTTESTTDATAQEQAAPNTSVFDAGTAERHFVETQPDGTRAVVWPSLRNSAPHILELSAADWAEVARAAFWDDRVHDAFHDALWDALVKVVAERRAAAA